VSNVQIIYLKDHVDREYVDS